MNITTLEAILEAKRHGRPAVVVTSIEDHTQHLYVPKSLETSQSLDKAVQNALQTDRSQIIEIDGQRQFIQVFNSPLRMLIVGAVHIAQVLIPMAQACGYAVTLIDPRRAFASKERFPDVELDNNWPDKALAMHEPDSRTAVVTLTHDPKLDEPALIEALQSKAFYVGSLGSRRTHQARCERLAQAEVKSEKLKQIHAPIGLNIGAVSPAEIAVSIMAQITAALRQKAVR